MTNIFFREAKRAVCMLALCLIASAALLAQDTEVAHPWRAGVSIGGNYNWYSIDTHYQTDYGYTGFFGGSAAAFGQYDFFPWFGLRAELEVSERNHIFYRNSIYSGTRHITLNTYLQMPMMAQFSFGSNEVRGFFNTGVYAGYWASSRIWGTMVNSIMGEIVKINQPYIFHFQKDRRLDLGLAGSMGIEYFPAEHWVVSIEGRCYYSLLSTVRQYMAVADFRYNTTIALQIGAAYIF